MLKSKKEPNTESTKEKYLVQGLGKDSDPKTWYLVFRVPQRFGGKLIRQSLFTRDLDIARNIRDKYIIPILTESSAISALEAIGKSILQSQGNAVSHMTQLKNIITASDGIKLPEASDKYRQWMISTSGLRPSTIQKYTEALKNAIDVIGGDKAAGMLSKEDASRLRDKLIKAGKSATTIDNIFSTFRGFLRWLIKEGRIASPYVVENFLIDLPPVRKQNTSIVPPSKADEAMNVIPEWSLVARIARYTGMRIGEIEACLVEYKGCGIVTVEGYPCFRISKELCKTHDDRYVPVSNKLHPFLTPKEIKRARSLCATFDADGRRFEGTFQKKYNRRVKKIEGCEKVKCHSWRVYAQTMMVEAGIDDLIVRRIVGHKDGSNVHYGYTAGRIEAMKKALDTIP